MFELNLYICTTLFFSTLLAVFLKKVFDSCLQF